MKNGFLFYVLLIQLTNIIFCLIPLWNFEKTSREIKNHSSFTMYNEEIKVIKRISLDNGEVVQKNEVYINDIKAFDSEWDDIEMFTSYGGKYYICPKGGYHLTIYDSTGGNVEIKNIGQVEEKSGFELKCYYQPKRDSLFISYVFINRQFYDYYLKLGNINSKSIREGLLDFKWTTEPDGDNNFNMIALTFHNKNIFLDYVKITINPNEDNFNVDNNKLPSREVCKGLIHSKAYFNDTTKNFYYITYNDNKLISGFSEKGTEITYDNIYLIPITENEIEFNFIDDITINSIDFIKNTKYVYYNLTTSKNENYYGIIDIEINKIIYNTNQEISEFKTLTGNSILAISGSKAYVICTIIGENDECLYECENGEILIDSQKPNSCNSECDTFTLIPENICVPTCDEEIYVSKDSKCGLCKDIDDEGKKYKFINGTICLNEMPKNAKIANEKLFLLECEDGYKLEQNECKLIIEECPENCESCETDSDSGNLVCTKCGNKYFLEEGNCVENCSEHYFKQEDDNKCYKCDEHCKTCSKGPENNIHNCKTCDNETEYKYLFDLNKTCVSDCPNGTELNEEKTECINQSESDDKNSGKKSDYMLWIFLVMIAILLLIIFLCICKKFCNKKKDNSLIEKINNEIDDKEMTN